MPEKDKRGSQQGLNISEVIFGEAKKIDKKRVEIIASVFVTYGKDSPAFGVEGQFLINGLPWKNKQWAVNGRLSEKLILSGKKPVISLLLSSRGKNQVFTLSEYDFSSKIKKSDKKEKAIRITIDKSIDDDEKMIAFFSQKDETGKKVSGKLLLIDNEDLIKILSEIENIKNLNLTDRLKDMLQETDEDGHFLYVFKKNAKARQALLIPQKGSAESISCWVDIDQKKMEGEKENAASPTSGGSASQQNGEGPKSFFEEIIKAINEGRKLAKKSPDNKEARI